MNKDRYVYTQFNREDLWRIFTPAYMYDMPVYIDKGLGPFTYYRVSESDMSEFEPYLSGRKTLRERGFKRIFSGRYVPFEKLQYDKDISQFASRLCEYLKYGIDLANMAKNPDEFMNGYTRGVRNYLDWFRDGEGRDFFDRGAGVSGAIKLYDEWKDRIIAGETDP